MSDIKRITPEAARLKVLSGKAMLVCAYASHEKFLKYHLEGAIPFSDLQSKEKNLSRNQEVIFY